MEETITRYEQMHKAAQAGLRRRIDRNKSVHEYLERFIGHFNQYCDIPHEQVAYFIWYPSGGEKEKISFDPKIRAVNVLTYDEENDRWSIGISLRFSRFGVSPEIYAAFGLSIKEHEGAFKVSVGPGAAQVLDLNVQTQREKFFGGLVEQIKDSFTLSRPQASKIGFDISERG